MLKILPSLLKTKLLEIFNQMPDSGIYPHTWRSATIIPIRKPNKPSSDINSYRTISLLSCLGKTLEKKIARRLIWFINRHNLISHNQVAFKKKHSTMDALLRIQHFASNALSTKNHVSILATDFERAFDRVGIHAVLCQLGRWGIGPRLYNLIKAFMTNRSFRVRLNNVTSPLSVVLFMIEFEEINNILSRHKEIHISLYADDAIIFTKIKNINVVKIQFLEILHEINSWGATSGASLATDKCQLLHIFRKHRCNPFNIDVNNKIIKNVNFLKILGITFDSKLVFQQHCQILRQQLETRFNIIKFVSSKYSCMHIKTIIEITRALMLSKID